MRGNGSSVLSLLAFGMRSWSSGEPSDRSSPTKQRRPILLPVVKVYAVVLVIAVGALLAWIMARAFSVNIDRPSLDPEARFGVPGRRVVAAMVGFGMAGMSAEFSPRDISWPWALVLAVIGAAAAAWYAGWVDRDDESDDPGPEMA